jgi:transcriptional regulator with PAS, ATPase and Fis domain
MTANALRRLKEYRWPGNVRELRNVIERAVLMNPGAGPITEGEVALVLADSPGPAQSQQLSELSLDEIEQLHIRRVLEASGGNKTQAAKTLNIDYKTLLAKLKKYRLTSD